MMKRRHRAFFSTPSLRLGSKLPAGVSQPSQFAKRPWETQPQARVLQEPAAGNQCQHTAIDGRPLNHIPHIRNPKLRQYYLQGTLQCSIPLGRARTVCSSSDGRCLLSVPCLRMRIMQRVVAVTFMFVAL